MEFYQFLDDFKLFFFRHEKRRHTLIAFELFEFELSQFRGLT
jgi:hypothetical protein